jgi:hypothetical protein
MWKPVDCWSHLLQCYSELCDYSLPRFSFLSCVHFVAWGHTVSVDVWLPLSLVLSHYRVHFQGALEDGPIGCPETSLTVYVAWYSRRAAFPAFFLACLTLDGGSVRLSRNVGKYQSMQHNIPEERRYRVFFKNKNKLTASMFVATYVGGLQALGCWY